MEIVAELRSLAAESRQRHGDSAYCQKFRAWKFSERVEVDIVNGGADKKLMSWESMVSMENRQASDRTYKQKTDATSGQSSAIQEIHKDETFPKNYSR